MRCAACGALPSEECDARVHWVHDKLHQDYRAKKIEDGRRARERQVQREREKLDKSDTCTIE